MPDAAALAATTPAATPSTTPVPMCPRHHPVAPRNAELPNAETQAKTEKYVVASGGAASSASVATA